LTDFGKSAIVCHEKEDLDRFDCDPAVRHTAPVPMAWAEYPIDSLSRSVMEKSGYIDVHNHLFGMTGKGVENPMRIFKLKEVLSNR
jgi:hypothetical protein